MTISKKATNRLWDVGDLALMVERRAAGPGAERALRENEVIDLIAEPIDNPALECESRACDSAFAVQMR